MGPAVQMLTGAPYFQTDHWGQTPDDLWKYIDEKLAANWVITTASMNGPGND